MCGRFTLAVDDWSQLLNSYGVMNDDFYNRPRYNIAPTQDVSIIISDGKHRKAGLVRWGLIPNWSQREKTSFSTINARVETLMTKPAFKGLLQRKRCLILADSFIEWHRITKKPERIRLRKRSVFAFAGLYDVWRREDGQKIGSCSIITCRPNEFMTPIHDRMPVILSRAGEDEWLNPSNKNPNPLLNLLQPYYEDDMYSYPISDMINNVKYDSFHLVMEDKGLERNDRHVFF